MRMFTIAFVLASLTTISAQEFKINKSSGRLEIRTGRVTVEGYSGNEIIFSSRDGKNDDDDRAAGLQSINAAGLTDNTGLGVNVTEKGDVIRVNQLRRTNS